MQLPVMPPILDGQNQSDPYLNLERHNIIPDQEGYYHVEDMRFNKHQYKLFFGTEVEQELARNALNSKSKRWPHGVLPYKFNPSVTAANQKKIKNCMAKFNNHFQNCIIVRYVTMLILWILCILQFVFCIQGKDIYRYTFCCNHSLVYWLLVTCRQAGRKTRAELATWLSWMHGLQVCLGYHSYYHVVT